MSTGAAKVSLILELKNKIHGGFQKAKQYVNENVRDLKSRISSLKESSISAFKEMTGSVPGLGDVIRLAKNPVLLLTTAILALGAAYSKASAMATQFETSMAASNVTLQESAPMAKETRDKVSKIASESKVRNAHEVAPAAFNTLVSAGLDKETALASLDKTMNMAKAGNNTDPNVVANALASTMNTTGIKDAIKIYDVLSATLNKGKAEFKDIAQYLPKIIPVAKNVGVSFEQVSGAYAQFTKTQAPERAATLLENLFKTIGDPEKAKNFKKIGVDFFDTAGKMKPLESIAEQLSKKLDGLTDENRTKLLDSLGLDMESANAFALMGQDVDGLKDSINATTNSAGEYQKSVENSKTSADGWIEIQNKIDRMWIRIGERVNETLGPIGEWLAPIAAEWLPAIADGFMWIWDTVSSILSPIAHIGKSLIEWITKSELIRDIASLIGGAFSIVGDIIKGVGNAISWVYDHTLKPILDGLEWIYGKAKSLLGLADEAADHPITRKANLDAYAGSPEATAAFMGGGGMASPFLMMAKGMKEMNANKKKNADFKGGDDKNKKEKGSSIKGAEQVRNITTNIGNVINGDFVTKNQQFSNMSPQDFQRFLVDIITRYTRGMELSTN